jgi:hypothetical protein
MVMLSPEKRQNQSTWKIKFRVANKSMPAAIVFPPRLGISVVNFGNVLAAIVGRKDDYRAGNWVRLYDDALHSDHSSKSLARFAKPIALLAVLAFGALRAWIARYSLNPDGTSYLDLSDVFRSHDWHGFLNAYWSPLYPALLGISRMVLPTSKYWELPAAHILNFAIFAAVLACFEFFYSSLRNYFTEVPQTDREEPVVTGLPFWFFAHALFLWTALDLISVGALTPDLCVAGFLYLIAGLILRFRMAVTWKLTLSFGIVLGLSYWAKAVMFPLAFAFMIVAFVGSGTPRQAISRLLITLAIFAAIAGPLVAALSIQKHRLTFGDSGRLNYAMFVSPGGATRNWQGDPGHPAVHPTRKIFSTPAVYEFAEPISGTFPPWFDPSYWQEGRTGHFRARAQMRIAIEHLLSYADLLLYQGNALLLVLMAFGFVLRKDLFAQISRSWPLLLMCVAGFGLYMLVHAETRFLGAYVAIFWMALFSALSLPKARGGFGDAIFSALSVALLVMVLGNAARAVREGGQSSALPELILSDRMDALGLHPGDRVAAIGSAGFYGARASQAKIVAEIMGEDAPAFWHLSAEEKTSVFEKFREAGARMIIAADPGRSLTLEPSWIKVPGLPFYIRLLESSPTTSR